MEYSKKNDMVSCFVCSLFPQGPGRKKASDVWVKGIRSWDKSVVKTNQASSLNILSEAHKAAFGDLAQFANNMNQVDVLLNKQLLAVKVQQQEDNIRNQEVIKILLDIAGMILMGTLFRLFISLCVITCSSVTGCQKREESHIA